VRALGEFRWRNDDANESLSFSLNRDFPSVEGPNSFYRRVGMRGGGSDRQHHGDQGGCPERRAPIAKPQGLGLATATSVAVGKGHRRGKRDVVEFSYASSRRPETTFLGTSKNDRSKFLLLFSS
jgi:hypothetical protein